PMVAFDGGRAVPVAPDADDRRALHYERGRPEAAIERKGAAEVISFERDAPAVHAREGHASEEEHVRERRAAAPEVGGERRARPAVGDQRAVRELEGGVVTHEDSEAPTIGRASRSNHAVTDQGTRSRAGDAQPRRVAIQCSVAVIAGSVWERRGDVAPDG